VPFYELSGKLLASMAAFKKHVKVGVWQDMRPEMVDVTTLAELPPAAEHAKKLKAAVEHARRVGKPVDKSGPAKKAPVKKAPIEKAPAKKAPIKKAPAKKALPGRAAKKPRSRE
jgi:hypothetical protein